MWPTQKKELYSETLIMKECYSLNGMVTGVGGWKGCLRTRKPKIVSSYKSYENVALYTKEVQWLGSRSLP